MKRLPLIIAFIAALLASCSRAPVYQQLDGSTWNTLYHIVYKSPVNLDDSIRLVMKQVELSLSPFIDSSLISRVNRGEPVAVDSMIAEVFTTSVAVNRHSGGMFDPTVAPLVNLWGFGYRDNDGVTPTDAMIDSVLLSVGIAGCTLDTVTGIIHKKSPATEFNFSAITKGFGCDMIASMFRRNGVTDYMIEIGGEIAMSGVNDRGKPWRIQIDSPIMNDTAIVHERLAVIAPGDCGIATSGNYRNFRRDENGNPSFGHTISPVTGRPVSSMVASATVIAPGCMLADALATACMAMNPDSALAMIERIDGASVLLIKPDGNRFVSISSSRFPTLE